jgi:hypothetical protein
VADVPPNVVMWVDHEHADGALCLNADLIDTPTAQQLEAALKEGSCTAAELIQALVARGG